MRLPLGQLPLVRAAAPTAHPRQLIRRLLLRLPVSLAAIAAKVWTGTSAHTPVVPRHMQPESNRTGGPQKKGAPAASPIKMGEFEDVSSESEKEDYVSEEEDYEAGCAPSALAPVCPPESPPAPLAPCSRPCSANTDLGRPARGLERILQS